MTRPAIAGRTFVRQPQQTNTNSAQTRALPVAIAAFYGSNRRSGSDAAHIAGYVPVWRGWTILVMRDHLKPSDPQDRP